MSITSVASAAMMSSMGHGHTDGGMDHIETHFDSPCEHSEKLKTSHTHQMKSDNSQLEETDTMLSCSMCALCTSIATDMDVNLERVSVSFRGYEFEVNIFRSKAPKILHRPPRS